MKFDHLELQININDLMGAARTVGALMAGNAFVGWLMMEKSFWDVKWLLFWGAVVMISSCIKRKSS